MPYQGQENDPYSGALALDSGKMLSPNWGDAAIVEGKIGPGNKFKGIINTSLDTTSDDCSGSSNRNA